MRDPNSGHQGRAAIGVSTHRADFNDSSKADFMLPKDIENQNHIDTKLDKKQDEVNETNRLLIEKELKEEKKRLKQSILIELGLGPKEKETKKKNSHPMDQM
jgi:hypothetical protein